MLGIGGFELFLIVLFGFLIVGPDRLPQIAKTVGKAIGKFRNAQEEMSKIVKPTDVFDPKSDEPFKNPLDALAKAGDALTKTTGSSSGKKNSAASGSKASSGTGSSTAQAESFSERKARYDRERAAKRAAEKEAAEREAAAAAAAASAALKTKDKPKPSSEKISDADDAAGANDTDSAVEAKPAEPARADVKPAEPAQADTKPAEPARAGASNKALASDDEGEPGSDDKDLTPAAAEGKGE